MRTSLIGWKIGASFLRQSCGRKWKPITFRHSNDNPTSFTGSLIVLSPEKTPSPQGAVRWESLGTRLMTTTIYEGFLLLTKVQVRFQKLHWTTQIYLRCDVIIFLVKSIQEIRVDVIAIFLSLFYLQAYSRMIKRKNILVAVFWHISWVTERRKTSNVSKTLLIRYGLMRHSLERVSYGW